MQSQVVKYWQEYAKDLEKNGKKVAAKMLEANLPSLVEEETIEIVFSSQAQVDSFSQIRVNLTNFLRQKLGNYFLIVKHKIEEMELKKAHLSEIELWKKLRNENTSIEKLNQLFKLEIR
ncbi:MAG: hypothetical protein N4A45_13075 [Flavobacteriales bacterium]|jgi:hypothetical protein|nr:hypothetical protein [Flavobacteriales bacterium]